MTDPYVSPNYSRKLTRYLESALPTFGVGFIPEGNYHEVCGAEAGSGDVGLISQFSRQIGCPEDDPTQWKDKRLHFRTQFDKARNCFVGRVRKMADYSADTDAEKDSRKRHAYAAQAAYTIGRDCLRKFQDVQGGLEKYTESASDLIESMPAGVKTALKTDNTGKVWSSIDEAITHNPELEPIYSNKYGLSDAQWDSHKRYMIFSAIDTTNIPQGSNTLAAIKRRYERSMKGLTNNSDSNNTNESNNNIRGGVAKSAARTRRRKKPHRTTVKNAAANVSAANLNLLSSNLSKITLTAATGGGTAAASTPAPAFVFPSLISVNIDDLAKDSAGKSYNVKTFMAWKEKHLSDTQITHIVSTIQSGTPSSRTVVMRVKLLPLLYYYTSASILFNYFEKLKDKIQDKYSKLINIMLRLNISKKTELYKKAQQEYELLHTLLSTYTDLELLSLCQTVFDTYDNVFGRITKIDSLNETIMDYNKLMNYFNKSMTYYLEQSPIPLYNLRIHQIWPYLKDEPVNELIEQIAKIFN